MDIENNEDHFLKIHYALNKWHCQMALSNDIVKWRCQMALSNCIVNSIIKQLCQTALSDGIVRWHCQLALTVYNQIS